MHATLAIRLRGYPALDTQYFITTDKNRLEIPMIHAYLSGSSYWAAGRAIEAVRKSIDNSLCFSVLTSDGRQVGFARVVTDYSTFAWLCEVFVLEQHRGRGLGKRLVEAIASHSELSTVRRMLLATRDAHELYRRYAGFSVLEHPERWMERLPTDPTASGTDVA